jgi:hypothetical protein
VQHLSFVGIVLGIDDGGADGVLVSNSDGVEDCVWRLGIARLLHNSMKYHYLIIRLLVCAVWCCLWIVTSTKYQLYVSYSRRHGADLIYHTWYAHRERSVL